MDYPELMGERIDLVALDESKEHLNDLHEYSVMPEFYRHLEFGVFKDTSESRKYLAKLLERSNSGNGHYWFIKHKKDNKVIGSFGVLDIDTRRRTAEIGYGLSPAYWGAGYFNEVLRMALGFLFLKQNFYMIWAKTSSTNEPSIKALQKLGFTRDGALRDFYLSSQTGKRSSAVILSITADEYKKLYA